ncbi:5'-nucleotidase C-terminal domain-containing protein [Sphingobacterium gobiense]|uniref:5'-nucleotidase C-terminal domain-containing protein n=1 Tax=Sphingobacterium gobiense TaxID=1382456 RepID=UPI001FE7C90C|nr:5'-nucleotidase [Sphingobacterium gobiense]
MNRSLLWCVFLSVAILLSSCKTQLYHQVNNGRYYQIDTTIVADSSILAYYAPYKEQLEIEMNRVIGFAAKELPRGGGAQSLLGNFFADALLWKGQQLDPEVQASFATKGGIRADLRAGDITVGNIFEIMPFENAVTILTLSGGDMLRWAEYMATTGGQPVSGIQLVIEDKKVKEFLIQGKPVDLAATYKLATYDYLANGGDYVSCFDNPIARSDHPQRIRETLMEYVISRTTQGKNIQAQLDGRVQIIR